MTKAAIVDLEEEGAREATFKVALSMYLGEQCRFCHGIFETLDDLKTAVWAGYHEHGRIAHKACFEAQPPDVLEALKQALPRDRPT